MLPSFIKERLQNTLLMSWKSATEQILRAKAWLYGFESVFRQVWIDFLIVVYLLFFLTAWKIEYRQFFISFYKKLEIVNQKDVLVDF